MSHYADAQALTGTDALVLAVLLSPIAALYAWAIARVRRARADIRQNLSAAGYQVVELQRRLLRFGPFTWWSVRSHVVYRVRARDAEGRLRTVWARWGRTWLFSPDTLELRWDD